AAQTRVQLHQVARTQTALDPSDNVGGNTEYQRRQQEAYYQQLQQQQAEEDRQAAIAELKASRVRYAGALADVQGFPETYMQLVQQDPTRDPKEHMAATLRIFRSGYETLRGIFEGQNPSATSIASSPRGGSPIQPGVNGAGSSV